MVGSLTAGEEAQLAQTIEMFEVIAQSQPQDYQSLEILKEAYAKLGREADLVYTSKRIAHAYVLMGQLSSAILEYEGILQRFPDDQEAATALAELESKAGQLNGTEEVQEVIRTAPSTQARSSQHHRALSSEVEDGKQMFQKIFVDGKIITQSLFDQYWVSPDPNGSRNSISVPFIQALADKSIVPMETSLRVLSDKARMGFLPLEKYDVDYELARTFPAEVCRHHCVLAFDRLSKSVLVATANPFNRQAIAEMEEVAKQRLLFYLAPPADITKALRKAFRH